MSLKYLASNTEFNLSDIKENLVFVFVVSDEKFLNSQTQPYQKIKAEISSLNAKVLFVTSNSELGGQNSELILDQSGTLIGMSPGIKLQRPGNNLMILENQGQKLVHIETKKDPESSSNWVEAVKAYAENYRITEPDSDNYYKWGQKVPQDGEYLCKDCGFILELKAGQIFPICEVCLSGEPTGPAGPREGYWELV